MARRAGAAFGVLVAGLLGALVVLGIVTGIDRDFEKGRVELAPYLGNFVVGFAVLVLLGAAGLTMSRRRPGGGLLLTAGVLLWLVWAYLRIGEYAS
jgi:hypothetical protein